MPCFERERERETGVEHWTAGLDYRTGLLDWTLDCSLGTRLFAHGGRIVPIHEWFCVHPIWGAG